VARRKLRQLEIAVRLDDLRIPPGNRLEALRGDRAGQHGIRINNHFRLCLIWSDAGRSYWLRAQAAHDPEVAST
jgi:proteic killer suppression protein